MSEITQIRQSLESSSEALQDLRSKYDGALTKINEANTNALQSLETSKNEALNAVETKKTQSLEALETSKAEQGVKINELESKMAELEKLFITEDNQILIKVGNNAEAGEIASLKEAYNLAIKYTPSIPNSPGFNYEKNRVVIEIQEGWEFDESIAFYNVDLSHIILTQKNPNVPINTSFEKAHLHADNGILSKIYAENSALTIKELNLKAKAKNITENECWAQMFVYVRMMSRLNVYNIKLDSTLLSTQDNVTNGVYPLWVDDNSLGCFRKIELIHSTAVNEGACIALDGSKSYVETFISSGERCIYSGFSVASSSSCFTGSVTINNACGHNGFLINASSSCLTGSVTINNACGHNGFLVTSSSSCFTGSVTINNACGHNGCRIDSQARWYNNANLKFGGSFSASGGYKISLSGLGFATIRNTSLSEHEQGVGTLCNVTNGVYSAHGLLSVW